MLIFSNLFFPIIIILLLFFNHISTPIFFLPKEGFHSIFAPMQVSNKHPNRVKTLLVLTAVYTAQDNFPSGTIMLLQSEHLASETENQRKKNKRTKTMFAQGQKNHLNQKLQSIFVLEIISNHLWEKKHRWLLLSLIPKCLLTVQYALFFKCFSHS